MSVVPGINLDSAISNQTQSTLGNGIVASDNGLIRLATNAEVVSEAELTAALAPYLTSNNAASTYAALAGATFSGPITTNGLTANGLNGVAITMQSSQAIRSVGAIFVDAGTTNTGSLTLRFGGSFTTHWSMNASGVRHHTSTLFTTGILTSDVNLLEMRNGTNAQGFLLNNRWTSATNRETGFVRWVNDVLQIGTEKGSLGGAARALVLQTDGVDRLTIAATGNITISQSLTVTSDVVANGNMASTIYLVGGSSGPLLRDVSGIIEARNNANNAFAPVRLGGLTWTPFTTSQTPAANGQLTLEMTSNTAGNLVYRGSDGVTRRMALTFT